VYKILLLYFYWQKLCLHSPAVQMVVIDLRSTTIMAELYADIRLHHMRFSPLSKHNVAQLLYLVLGVFPTGG
jgi:hypothetical protein